MTFEVEVPETDVANACTKSAHLYVQGIRKAFQRGDGGVLGPTVRKSHGRGDGGSHHHEPGSLLDEEWNEGMDRGNGLNQPRVERIRPYLWR